MEEVHPSRGTIRFGVFEVDLRAGELRKQGVRIKLQEQPFQILRILLEHPGEVVTREQLQKRIWPADTFVDFDHGLNNAVKRLRESLSDSAETPRFIETLPKRGYRFVGAVNGATSVTSVLRTLRDRRPLRALAIPAGAIVLLAVFLGLNVGSLRGRLLGRSSAPPIRSLAVLPLQNLSGDPSQEYFADAMTEALITDLAQISALRVISRTSTMRYKGTDKPLPEIARELGVQAIIEGSVLRAGDQVRIRAQLIDAANDTHLWAQTYDRDLRDVLAVHRDVAQAVAGEIRIKLSPQEAARLGSRKPVNPEAYDAYLRGRYYWNKRTVEDFRKSIEFFKRAIELGPAYAPAYAGLADAYNLLGSYGAIPIKESHPRARAAAMNALEIDEQLGEAHASLATIIADYYWDWAETEKEFKRAIQLSPNYAVGHYWYANYLMFMGRLDEALTQARRAEELDPLNPIVPTYVASVLYEARRYEEAITELRRVLLISPDFVPAHTSIGLVYIQKHMFAEAVAEFRQALSVNKDDPRSLAYTGYALGAAGKLAEARKIRNELQRLSAQRYVSAYEMAVANIGAGYNDRALDWLEKGYEERNWYLGGLRVEPLWDPLRSHPRFQDLLRRMNFPG